VKQSIHQQIRRRFKDIRFDPNPAIQEQIHSRLLSYPNRPVLVVHHWKNGDSTAGLWAGDLTHLVKRVRKLARKKKS
jgi:hypothetical protein